MRTEARYAVISIGMQNDTFSPDGFFHSRGELTSSEVDRSVVLGNVGAIMRAARAADRPVIHATWTFRADYLDCCFAPQRRLKGLQEARVLVEDTWGAELTDGVDYQGNDFIVRAKAHSAFEFTHLDRVLRNCGVETCVLIGGPAADGIDDTARQGAAYGYRVVLVRDSIFPLMSDHLASLSGRADAVTTKELIRMIEFDAMPRPALPGSPHAARVSTVAVGE